MRYLMCLFSILLVTGMFACTKDNNTITNPGNSFLVYISGEFVPGFWDHSGLVLFDQPKFQISGKIIAEKIVIPDYVQLGDSIFYDSDINFLVEPGNVSFQRIIENLDQNVNFLKVQTEMGAVSGNLVVPDEASNISFSSDNITYDEEFTVSWTCEHATAYKLNYYIKESQFPGYSFYKDTTLTSQSVKVFLGNSYYANKNFKINIQPINTPNLEVGTGGNMQGAGSGFISCYGAISSAEKMVLDN